MFVDSKPVSGRVFVREATGAHTQKKKRAGDREEVCLNMIELNQRSSSQRLFINLIRGCRHYIPRHLDSGLLCRQLTKPRFLNHDKEVTLRHTAPYGL